MPLRRVISSAALLVLVAYALASVYAAGSAFWQQRGTLGLSTDYDARVRTVAPGEPAALAGVVAADRIDLASVAFEDRRYVAGVGAAVPVGTSVRFRLVHGESARDVTLRAVPAVMNAADRSSLFAQCVASLVFIAVGTTLIRIRPNAATWGFGLYCLLELPTASYPFLLPSAATALWAIVIYDVVQNLGVVGLIVFALDFPQRLEGLWRGRVRRMLPTLFVVLAAMTAYPDIANLVLGTGAEVENRLLQVAFGVVFGLALAILWRTYRHIARDERERLRWVLIGFGFGLVTSYVGNTLSYSSLLALDPPAWLADVLVSLNVLLPITVAHAVVRHRVFDIDFVIGRALVYAVLTTLLAGVFTLLDWSFGYVLEDFRFSRLLQAGISIGIAFTFDSLHKLTERTVEALFFRKRRAAETRLDRLTRELPQARSVRVVEEALAREVVAAFRLTSAAIFVQDDAGVLRRTASEGWLESDLASLDDTDLLVLSMRADRRSIELADFGWNHAGLPSGAAAPVVAVQIYSRSDLSGIAFYGSHVGGADVDPGELAQLERLAHAASVALDELEAERLRAENALQLTEIHTLEARLDELRRLRLEPS